MMDKAYIDLVSDIITRSGFGSAPVDANDLLNLFAGPKLLASFFVNHAGKISDEVYAMITTIKVTLAEYGFTLSDTDLFFDYGLDYAGEVKLEGRDY